MRDTILDQFGLTDLDLFRDGDRLCCFPARDDPDAAVRHLRVAQTDPDVFDEDRPTDEEIATARLNYEMFPVFAHMRWG